MELDLVLASVCLCCCCWLLLLMTVMLMIYFKAKLPKINPFLKCRST